MTNNLFPEARENWPCTDLFNAADKLARERNLIFWAGGNKWADFSEDALKPGQRFVVLWKEPLSLQDMFEWRNQGIEDAKNQYLHLTLPATEPADWEQWLILHLACWPAPQNNEEPVIEVGSLVRQPSSKEFQDCALLLATRNPAQLEVINKLDKTRMRFRESIGKKVGERRVDTLKTIKKWLQNPIEPFLLKKELSDVWDKAITRSLPKVLILAPSGSGKSMVVNYLALRSSYDKNEKVTSRRKRRLPIPEYLEDEQRLEYDLFGYTPGAYTGAISVGNPGLLLENMGGVIFLDEIGDSSPRLQAKLLAFLDDYRVLPRGCNEAEGIYCPVMVVAATNRPIREWAHEEKAGKGHKFRNDLFQRFDVVIDLPSISDRREDIPLMVDLLLQDPAINPDRKINKVSINVIEQIETKFSCFAEGNFREMERVLKDAVARAVESNRDVLLSFDLQSL